MKCFCYMPSCGIHFLLFILTLASFNLFGLVALTVTYSSFDLQGLRENVAKVRCASIDGRLAARATSLTPFLVPTLMLSAKPPFLQPPVFDPLVHIRYP
ncbi:hypothetical protein EYR40_008981 [Pleurotus pulmonarius]|nr:hypothetical protein EYR40_008981 [Pleurotus pulmonarius]